MPPKTVLVATDFSEPSRVGVDWAATLAKSIGAKLIVANVFDLPIVGLPDASLFVSAATATRMLDDAQSSLDAEVARVKAILPSTDGVVRQGDPREAVPELAASLGAELVVVGSHGRRGLRHALVGSVAEAIVRHCTVPVVVVR